MERREQVRRSSTSDQQNYHRQASSHSPIEDAYEELSPPNRNGLCVRWFLIFEVVLYIYFSFARLETLKYSQDLTMRYSAAGSATFGLTAAVYLTKIWSRKHVSSASWKWFLYLIFSEYLGQKLGNNG